MSETCGDNCTFKSTSKCSSTNYIEEGRRRTTPCCGTAEMVVCGDNLGGINWLT